MPHLKAVIFDWAGTLIDHGCLAPVAAMQDIFAAAGVPISAAEARQSMGLPKLDHIRAILAIPRVREACRANALDLYEDFVPQQIARLKDHAQLITGIADAAQRMRALGLKIGSTTGYNREMLDYVLEQAATQGFAPDCSVCPEEAGGGRPMPWMCYQNALLLRVYPPGAIVKIGDTPSDIEEGRNAGMWTIGITRTGNEAGLSEAEWNALPPGAQTEKLAQAEARLSAAHYLAGSVAECDDILQQIDARIRHGELP